MLRSQSKLQIESCSVEKVLSSKLSSLGSEGLKFEMNSLEERLVEVQFSPFSPVQHPSPSAFAQRSPFEVFGSSPFWPFSSLLCPWNPT